MWNLLTLSVSIFILADSDMLTRKSKIDGVILSQIRVSVPNSSRKAVASKEG